MPRYKTIVMITIEIKNKIISSLAVARENFTGSDAKFAVSIGINNAQYSRIKRGETEKVISDQNWISLARKLDVSLNNAPDWNVANTPVFQFVTAQLEMCQRESVSAMLCDLSDIGKTCTAEHYAKTHTNVVYIDCSQVKTKQKLIKQIAKSFGVICTGKYADIYEDLVFYVKTLNQPLIILDEAGDLQYDAFLELKALWNALEMYCAFYMIGADGLQEKMRRAINNRKVGYTELFSRFGKRYGKVVPAGGDDKSKFVNATAMMIIKANSKPGIDANKILRGSLGEDGLPSLRRIKKELVKTV